MNLKEAKLIPENLPSYNKDHHTGSGFRNDPRPPIHKPTASIFTKQWLKFLKRSSDCEESLPIHNPLPMLFNDNKYNNEEIRVFWLGHATCLIQFKDVYILTDPVFSKCASPLPSFVARVTPVPCEIEDLPPISVVLISHDHYDHLDYYSLLRIKKHSPDMVIFGPLVNAKLIRSWGFHSVEFDWRQHITYKGIEFTCFPARHAACRYGLDFLERLWCSWMLKFDKVTVYFPGDTAVGPHFQEIKEIMKDQVDLVMMPIGPQEPASWMRVVHLDPQDAYEMNCVLQPKCVFPIHYGTFPLGQKPDVPDIVKLKQVWKSDNLHIIEVGECMEWNGKEFVEKKENA